jgi:hypothetical protein
MPDFSPNPKEQDKNDHPPRELKKNQTALIASIQEGG